MKRDKRCFVFLLAVILIFLIVSVVFVEFRLRLIRDEMSEFTARNAAAGAILNGVEETVKNAGIYYNDIVEIHTDKKGEVKSVQTDTAKLNTVSNAVNRNVDKRISEMKNIPVKIPLTSFFGDEIISGLGPSITFYVTMTGSASTKFNNVFDSTGINQIRHQIMLDISVDVYVIFGRKIDKYNVKSNVCIAESIITGTSPNAFANLSEKK